MREVMEDAMLISEEVEELRMTLLKSFSEREDQRSNCTQECH